MAKIISRIDLDKLDNHSNLFLDYVRSGSTGLPPYLDGFSAGASFWKKKLAVERGRSGGRRAVISEVSAQSRKLGANDDVVEKLARADVQFVATGQQPGTLGGPLHTLYKIATAIAAAASIEDKTGAPCVPLYWCGADDTDFQEIRQLYLVSHAGSPVSTLVPQEAHTGGVPIGDIDLEWLRRVWDVASSVVGGFGKREFVERVVGGAFQSASDHGELSSAILTRLTEGRIAIVDGRSTVVKRYAQKLFERYVAEENDVKAEVESRGKTLAAAGYHAQLNVGTDSGVFLIEDGKRKAVGRDRYDTLLKAARKDVERCSPGVILRNLVQDFTFTPAAVVLGPAELAYRAQITGVYKRFGVPIPTSLPRLSGTFLPPDFLAPLEFVGGDADTLVTDPAAFMRAVYRRSLPGIVDESHAELQRQIGDAIDRYAASVEETLPAKTLGKLRGRLAEIRSRTEALADTATDAGKTVARERWPFVSSIDQVVKPAGKPQDRTLSVLSPFLWGGEAAAAGLTELSSQAVDELLDGRFRHIVYSTA